MPAPPSGLVTALRTGTAARHLFLYLDHSQGAVRAWDGIGEFTFGGNTYLGVGGMVSIQGVSNSADVQNHVLEILLNGAPLSALQITDPDIRGRAATLTAVWLDEDGGVSASRIVFSGVGDNLRSKIDRDTVSLNARIRAKMADWGTIPRAFYTPGSHNRIYPADTGFNQVKNLENATVNGWSKDVESTGETLVSQFPASNKYTNTTLVLLGTTNFGMGVIANVTTPFGLRTAPLTGGGGSGFIEETSGASVVGRNVSPYAIQVGGINAYLGIDGAVRSAGGKRIHITGGNAVSDGLRIGKAQTSDGAITAEVLLTETISASGYFRRSTYAAGAGDNRRVVYVEKGGFVGSAILGGYSEQGTGAAVSVVSGRLSCGGADCRVSTTGVIVSATGKRIITTADATKYLRVWT